MSEQRETPPAERVLVAYVCSDCGEQILHDPEWDSKRQEYVRGHYHDPPADWPGGEDPWFDAVEIPVAPAEQLEGLQAIIDVQVAEIDDLTWQLEGLREALREIMDTVGSPRRPEMRPDYGR